MSEWGRRTVGEVVAADWGAAEVFRSFGIDFCCGGDRTVAAACAEAGADVDEVTRALAAAAAGGAGGAPALPDPTTWDLELLANYITGVHHGYTRTALPVLRELTARVARVHGDQHPELLAIRDLVGELHAELERHMAEEEEVLFPRIVALKQSTRAGDGVEDAVSSLEEDHDLAGALLRRIRELSRNYTVPPDACASYRESYARLEAFERDLHRHVHLENNVLFPRAVAAERARAGEATPA